MLSTMRPSRSICSSLFCSLKHFGFTASVGRSKFVSTWDHRDMLSYDTVEVERSILEDNEWMKCDDARKLLGLVSFAPKQAIAASDVREYLQMRAASAHDLAAAEKLLAQPPAQRILSSLTTFPLTLSYGLSLLFRIPDIPLDSKRADDAPHFRRNVLIIGARSESSLPSIWWREFLFSHHSSLFRELNIRMVGPGLQPVKNIAAREVSSDCEIKRSAQSEFAVPKSLNIVINSQSSQEDESTPKDSLDDYNMLHNHPDQLKLLQWADAFVLFNPGVGNDTLREHWKPTIRLLLHTRKPILCTAYGAHDLRRDLTQLDSISAEEDDQELGEPLEFAFPPHENPFKSWKRTIDPKEEGDGGIVTTNHSIYAVQAK